MMRRLGRLLILGSTLGVLAWVNGAACRAAAAGRPLRAVLAADLRAFVTHRFDPLVLQFGLAGGRRSPWGIVEHVGRRSGRTFHTPVLPRLADDHLFIPLPYGVAVDWVRNVRHAGHCRLQLHETILDLDEPTIVEPSELEILPEPVQAAAGAMGQHYVRLHVLERVEGTFASRTSVVEPPPADVTPVLIVGATPEASAPTMATIEPQAGELEPGQELEPRPQLEPAPARGRHPRHHAAQADSPD